MPVRPPKHDTLLRQWQMLRLIPRSPIKITAGEIKVLSADGFNVAKRTVERDLMSLSEIFPLLSDEREKPFGWSWDKQSVPLDVPSLGNSEALAFKLIEQYLSGLLPHSVLETIAPYFRMAEQRLGALPSKSGPQGWINKIRVVPPTQPLLPPSIRPQVQQNVGDALLGDWQLHVRYRARDADNATEATIHPLAIIQRGAVTYLAATFYKYEDTRLLALHRIEQADILDAPVIRPKKFDIDRYIASGALGWGDGEMIRLEARFLADAAQHLYETPLSADQVIAPDGDSWVRLTSTVANTPQLSWWLLGFGDAAEVLRPASLRNQLKAAFKNGDKTYQHR